MPEFSEASKEKLRTCNHQLYAVMSRVVQVVDCTILEGHRNMVEQMAAVNAGKSKTPWPESKHNATPSNAVDVAPYPIVWPKKDSPTYVKDLARWYYFGGVVKATACMLGIPIRWGGDWDSDNDFKDQTFDDLPHFELLDKHPQREV